MHKISVYIPESHLDRVKNALFNAGAGKLGDYDHCAWQTKGEGQFRPLAGSNPTQGTYNTLETVIEYCVELVCEDHLLDNAITALKNAHPYEMPAFSTWKVLC